MNIINVLENVTKILTNGMATREHKKLDNFSSHSIILYDG